MMSESSNKMMEKEIRLLNDLIIKIENKDFDLEAWKSSTIIILESIFSDNNQKIRQIENIKLRSGGIATTNTSHFWHNMDSCKKRGKEILEACIIELENFGLSKKEDAKNNSYGITAGGNINIGNVSGQYAIGENIMQTQSVNQNDFRELIESLHAFQNNIDKLELPIDDKNIINGNISTVIKEVNKKNPSISIIQEKFKSTIKTIKEAGKTIENISELYDPAKKIAKLVGISLSYFL